MQIIGKIFSILLNIVLPCNLRDKILLRLRYSKMAFSSNLELRFFWKVLFFPIVLTISLFMATAKTIAIWIFPQRVYHNMRYILNQVYTDITFGHYSVRLALKRAALCNELFTKGIEKKVHFGDKNPDKTFFVIRPYYYMEKNELLTSISNLLFHYYRCLQHLSYALENGWIPVVDWENYGPFPHQEDERIIPITNCWEYYWNQPSEYTLEEVYQSQNVILSSQNTVDYGYIPPVAMKSPFSEYSQKLAECCPKYDQSVTLNNTTEQYVNQWHKRLFPPQARILGISIRGVSYGIKKMPSHPKQPTIANLIKAAKQTMQEQDIGYIFFACESAAAVNAMQEAFGDSLIVLPRERYEKPPTSEDDPLYVEGQRYQTNLDYLTEMVLLSRCTSLMAGMSSGVRAAIIWNRNCYESVEITENGTW